MTSYEILKDNPRFKAYCRRRLPQTRPTAEQAIASSRRKFQADFRAFCRPRGLLSVLKENTYETGRLLEVTTKNEHGEWSMTARETATLRKTGDEFVSVLQTHDEDAEVKDIAQEYKWPFGKVGDQLEMLASVAA